MNSTVDLLPHPGRAVMTDEPDVAELPHQHLFTTGKTP
jgi:hypothetical protein